MKDRPHALSVRLTAGIAGWILFCLAVGGLCFSWADRNAAYEDFYRSARLTVQRLAHNLRLPLQNGNMRYIETLIEQALTRPSVEAVLLEQGDRQPAIGRITQADGTLRPYSDTPRIRQRLAHCWMMEHTEIAVPDAPPATLRVCFTNRPVQQEIGARRRRLLGYALLSAAALCGGLLFCFRRLILTPLAALVRTAERLDADDGPAAVPARQTDAFGRVEQRMQRLAERLSALRDRNRELEEQAREREAADRRRSELFTNLTHEIRTPLSVISGQLEAIMAGRYGEAVSASHQVFRTIEYQSAALLKTVTDILDFSKIDAGAMPLHPTCMRVARFLQLQVAHIQPVAELQGLRLEFDNRAEDLLAALDPALFEKAVANLVSNALKFTDEGGTMTIRLQRGAGPAAEPLADDRAVFSVSVIDTGVGIAAEELPALFERFSQCRPTLQRKRRGTGLGLAFTQQIMDLHGGRITVRSRPGEGSEFTLILPCAVEPDDAADVQPDECEPAAAYWSAARRGMTTPAPRDGEPPPEAAAVILIVDDSAALRDYVRLLLRRDYRVIEAENGREGLDVILREQPDLVLADVMMPEMDGCEMLAEVRRRPELRGLPVLLLSAVADDDLRVTCLQLGANDYLIKPAHAGELQARIAVHLALKRLREADTADRMDLEDRPVRTDDDGQPDAAFQALTDALPAAVARVDADGRFRYLNRAAREFFALRRRRDAAGDHCFQEYVAPQERPECMARLRSGPDQAAAPARRCTLLDGRRQPRSVLLQAAPLNSGSHAGGLHIVFLEIHSDAHRAFDEFCATHHLTPREREILAFVVENLPYKLIADELTIELSTVKKHIRNIRAKIEDHTGLPVQGKTDLIKLVRDFPAP